VVALQPRCILVNKKCGVSNVHGIYEYITWCLCVCVCVCVSSLKVWALYVDHRYSVLFKITALFLKQEIDFIGQNKNNC